MQRYNLASISRQAANSTQSKGYAAPITRIVNLSGNTKKNIRELTNQLTCSNCCEAKQVLSILADKIEKLRSDRDALKKKYVEDVFALQARLKMLEQQNKCMEIKLSQLGPSNSAGLETCLDTGYLRAEDGYPKKILKQKDKRMGGFDKGATDYEQIRRIAIKYNICGEQLQRMLQQYLLGEQAVDEKEQRRLKHLQLMLLKQNEGHSLRESMQLMEKNPRIKRSS